MKLDEQREALRRKKKLKAEELKLERSRAFVGVDIGKVLDTKGLEVLFGTGEGSVFDTASKRAQEEIAEQIDAMHLKTSMFKGDGGSRAAAEAHQKVWKSMLGEKNGNEE